MFPGSGVQPDSKEEGGTKSKDSNRLAAMLEFTLNCYHNPNSSVGLGQGLSVTVG